MTRATATSRVGCLAPLASIAATATLALLLGGCKSDADEILTVAVERRDFAVTVEAPGELKARDAVTVSAGRARGGLTIAWLVAEGTLVHAGNAVVEFESQEAKDAWRMADAEFHQIEQEIAKQKVKAGTSSDELDSQVSTARIARAKAAFKASLKDGIVPAREIEQARMDLKLAEIDIGRIGRAVEAKRPQDDAELALLEIRLRKAGNQRDLAQVDLDATKVLATGDGVVSYQIIWKAGGRDKVAPGDSVWSGQAVLDLLDLSTMEFVAGVREEDAVHVAEGQPAKVMLSAIPGRPLAATVRHVAAVAEQSDRRVPVKRVEVRLALDAADPSLYAGLTGRAAIQTVARTSVLTVPPDALIHEAAERFVYVVTAGGMEKRAVTVAESGDDAVVVTDGLTDGERVYARDPTKTAEELMAIRLGRQEEARQKRKKPGESGQSFMVF